MYNYEVSVIVPVFNGEKYISSTLKHIISQDFDNFEIIVIDDGSTDNSFEIINQVLANSTIPYNIFKQKNKGVSSARNKGIELATGEYIIFVDCDDMIDNNYISSLFNTINNFDADFALARLQKVDNNGNILSKNTFFNQNVITTYEFLEKEFKMELSFNFCQFIYRASLLKKNNIKFNEKAVYGEDAEFTYNALIKGESIAIVNDTYYNYLQHESSAISTLNYRRFEFVETLEKLNMGEDLNNLIKTQRIPKSIFGNIMYFFYNNYSFNEVILEMNKKDLFKKLKYADTSDLKFYIKSRLFLLSPKIYYKLWKKFKNSI